MMLTSPPGPTAPTIIIDTPAPKEQKSAVPHATERRKEHQYSTVPSTEPGRRGLRPGPARRSQQ
ncbi:hypothetical protein AHiyo4_34950 [Arthrobacter sp. Hiyo4]|nr:hypothetical protein AHiyo4_34950 [Arthrobacter sp. Hiyo4]